jgi:hypothetical protein
LQVNYIKHLTATFYKMADDERLSPFHISLYLTLFQFWNLNRFKNPISIARQETMRLSKIGSVNTYIKCIKELDKWQYLKYLPSHNPLKGSLIHLYNFNNTTDNATDISPNKSSDNTDKKTIDKTHKQVVIPSINTLNNTNKLNCVNDNEQSQKNNLNNFSDDNSKSNSKSEQEKKEKSSAKKEKDNSSPYSGRGIEGERRESRFTRPLLEIVKNYFEQSSWPSIEADKFYNYFESNGWLVGGKTPMKNWQAAAKNWIINSNKFNQNDKSKQTPQQHHSAGKLHIATDKDFSEPL